MTPTSLFEVSSRVSACRLRNLSRLSNLTAMQPRVTQRRADELFEIGCCRMRRWDVELVAGEKDPKSTCYTTTSPAGSTVIILLSLISGLFSMILGSFN